MPLAAAETPRKMLPPPITRQTCTPIATTSPMSAAMARHRLACPGRIRAAPSGPRRTLSAGRAYRPAGRAYEPFVLSRPQERAGLRACMTIRARRTLMVRRAPEQAERAASSAASVCRGCSLCRPPRRPRRRNPRPDRLLDALAELEAGEAGELRARLLDAPPAPGSRRHAPRPAPAAPLPRSICGCGPRPSSR